MREIFQLRFGQLRLERFATRIRKTRTQPRPAFSGTRVSNKRVFPVLLARSACCSPNLRIGKLSCTAHSVERKRGTTWHRETV